MSSVELSPSLDVLCRTLAEEASDAVIYADVSGKIQFWNRGAERIFGFSAQEALGNSLDIIVPENLRRRHWDAYDQTMRTGETRYGAGDLLAVPAIRKGGARLSIEFSIIPLRDRDGHMLGVGAIMRDVSRRFDEMKELRKQLAELRKHADQAS